MAIVNAAILEALRTTFNTHYQRGLQTPDAQWQQLATLVRSTTGSNTYGWLGQFPRFREWIGERQYLSMKEHSYSISNKKFEASIKVDRDDIEDDNLGQYSMIFEEQGRAAATHPDELVFGLLGNGESTACYDGQNFFDTDHPVNSKVDGSGDDETVSNILEDANYDGPTWYLLDTSRAIKPLIFQQRRDYALKAMTKMDDETVFTEDVFRFGIDARVNTGFGFWQMAYAIKAELTPANFKQAAAAMRTLKADGGRPLDLRATLLACDPTLEDDAKTLVESEKIDGSTNIYRNRVKVLSSAWL